MAVALEIEKAQIPPHEPISDALEVRSIADIYPEYHETLKVKLLMQPL